MRSALKSTVTGLLAAFVVAALASPSPARAAGMPAQGVYEECGPATDGAAKCLDRLAQIRAAGFTVVLNYTQWYATEAQLLQYMARARELGIKLIFPLNASAWRDGTDLKSYYRYLGPDCSCQDGSGFLPWVIGLVKDDPATWGYYIGDELPPSELPAVQALGARVRAVDPAHPQLFVSVEDGQSLGGNIVPFADAADVIGADTYPIGTPDSPDVPGAIARNVQATADGHGRQSAFVLQSFSWTQYASPWTATGRFPSAAEMQRMRDLVLANSRPSLVLWYSFYDVERSDDPATHWADLTHAAFAPEPFPDTAVRAETTGSDRTFDLSSDFGSSFDCRLDGGGWSACPARVSYRGLAAGGHTFSARAVDRAGRTDPTPASFSWNVAGSATSGSATGHAAGATHKKRRPCAKLHGKRRRACLKRQRLKRLRSKARHAGARHHRVRHGHVRRG